MYESLYVTTDTTDGQNRYDSGNVYSVKKEAADKMVAEGFAEVVNAPTLHQMKQKAEELTNHFKKERERLKTSERYDSNESERQFLLDELTSETETQLKELEFSYKAELEALRIHAADEALKPFGSEEEREKAGALAEQIRSLVAVSPNGASVLRLLELKAKNCNDAERLAILGEWPVIEKAYGSDSKLKSIKSAFQKFESAPKHLQQLVHLDALERSGSGISTKYKQMKLIKERRSNGI